METSVLKKKILADLNELPPPKISEVVDFVEYLKTRQNNWKGRFKNFLKKIDPKMKKVSYAEISREITKVRVK